MSTLAVMGSRSRDCVTGLTGADLSKATFAIATWQDLHVRHRPVRAQRITYVGEVGWELHVQTECVQREFETILAAPQAPRLCGSMAVDGCRTEEGFRRWGHKVVLFDSPVEGGLRIGQFCAWL